MLSCNTIGMNKKTIEETKQKWESEFLQNPAVTGVAIGLCKDTKEKCIIVYATPAYNNTKNPKLPVTVEGFKVEVRIRKRFKAL
jgi:hypothetical protein